MQKRSYERDSAITAGRVWYTGKNPCKKCGSYLRYVSSYSCYDCTVTKGLEKLKNEGLMAPYRTKAKANAKTYRYRTRKLNQYPNDADNKLIAEYYKEAERLTEETGIKYSVGHIIPLSKGGLHHQNNLQVITLRDNIIKSNKIS